MVNTKSHGGFQLVMGVPQERWMVVVRENPTKIRMMTGGSPILGHLQMLEIDIDRFVVSSGSVLGMGLYNDTTNPPVR